ncbi:MAG: type II secretion system F family protein [Lachnospiraceae bacterium]|jgi:type IV pilus assembly protein PilC|nr:type II secretion system F family protein [Lachnospiraceae bacterium]
MPVFTYIGHNKDGYMAAGAKSFSSSDEMKQFLEKEGVVDFEVYESKTDYKEKLYASVSPIELSLFSKQMSVLFYSHMTLMEGIALLSSQTENKQLKIALDEIYYLMEKGRTFAEAMNMYNHIFPAYMLNMIIIGETSGTLDGVFQRLSKFYDKEGKVRKKIRSAALYPLVLGALMAGIILLLIVKIIPMFDNILINMGGELPTATAAILGASNFISRNIIIILLLLIAGAVAFKRYINTEKGSLWFDEYKLKSKLTKYIFTRSLTAKVSRSLSLLIKSGVQILNAMEIITPLLENKHLENKFKEANQKLKEGGELKDVFEEIGIFPPLFIRMLIIGQSSGHLDEMLDKCADVFDDEADDAIEKLAAMIEPVLIIILSIIVGIILLSVMLPMIDIMTVIG